MNLTRLATFAEVVRAGTFARAADRLHFTPSAVSQQMAKLEAELGVVLFERRPGGGEGVRLTAAGRRLRERSGALLALARALDAEVRDADDHAALRLGACPLTAAAWLPAVEAALRDGAGVLEVAERDAGELPGAVAAGEVDLAVLVAPAGAATNPEVREDVQSAPVAAAAIALSAPPGHPLARRAAVPAPVELRVLWPAQPAPCVDAAAQALARGSDGELRAVA